MEKHEVKQEYKEQEGSAEVKHRRREMHHEILSGQMKQNIEQSDFVLGNPTHIAIGIYTNLDIAPYPFISLVAKNELAVAVIAYAEKHGTPVVRDIPLARRIFKDARPYTFIQKDMADPIFRIVQWLKEVERNHLEEIGEAGEELEELEESAESEEAQELKDLKEPPV
jgi:type III secretion protein U